MVEKGYCPNCKTWRSAIPIPAAPVILGPRVQKYVGYYSVICRLSLSQTQQLLLDTHCIHISQGEIAKILKRQALLHRKDYEELKVKIRGSPIVHLDETGWKLLKDASRTFAWSMSTPEGASVYLVGESRGKGNVAKLLGDAYQGVAVTDDYAAYDTLPNHQLCWAHLLRKFRELAQSGEVAADTQAHYQTQYQQLAGIYTAVRDRRGTADIFTAQLQTLATHAPQDGKKLRTLKTTLAQNVSKYLTCLQDTQIPLTNNQAERSLRHLVLKRKISFGSHSKDTAEYFAILLSVLMSQRRQNPTGWFGEFVGV